jgi:hypothetical protein
LRNDAIRQSNRIITLLVTNYSGAGFQGLAGLVVEGGDIQLPVRAVKAEPGGPPLSHFIFVV